MFLFRKISVLHTSMLVSLVLVFASYRSVNGYELMLDPGHTARSPGALSCAGIPEYQYNQKLADYLIAGISPTPGVKVRVSRSAVDEPKLAERVKATRGLDLFVSLHHDSVQPQFVEHREVSGIKGNCSQKASGFSIFVSRKNPFFKKSLSAATRFANQLMAAGLHPTLHHAETIPGENRTLLDRKLGIYAFDELVVLREAQAPALLFEAGVIVNPVDEALVAEDSFRQKVLQALSAVIANSKDEGH